MCGRATLSTPPEELREAFGLVETPALPPRWNIAPSQPIAVVRAGPKNARRAELLRWGMVPSWAKDTKSGGAPKLVINARVESLAARFRESLERRRCLVLVDGFYEWQARGKVKQPFLVRRADGRPFALAGIWDVWIARDGEAIESCTIVTCPATPPCDALHDRMPLVVDPASWDLWLDDSMRDIAKLAPILSRASASAPAESDALTLREVSTRVNSADNDDATCIEPAAPSLFGPGVF